MSDDHGPERPGAPVPSRRLARLLRMGGLVGGIAGRTAATGLRQAAPGQRPRVGDVLLTPGNAQRVATELSRMRGAAMKIGQLISMDAGGSAHTEASSCRSVAR